MSFKNETRLVGPHVPEFKVREGPFRMVFSPDGAFADSVTQVLFNADMIGTMLEKIMDQQPRPALRPTRLVEYTTDGTWRPQTTFLAVVQAVHKNTVDIRVSRIAMPDLDLKGVPVERVRLVRKT